MLVPETLDKLLSVREVADECGVSVDTVHQWRKRGHIAPTGLDNNGRALYKMIDVLRASRDIRHRAVGAKRSA